MVGHIGTLGNAHGIETLVQVASLLRETRRVFFLVVGDGAEKGNLERLVKQKGLDNIATFNSQPRSRIPALVATCDICLVLLKKAELFKTVIPTKMLEFMSCGRPIVAAVDGEAARLLRKAGAGVCVPPEDGKEIADAILSLLKDSNARHSLGASGRAFVMSELTREASAQTYLSLLKNVLAKQANPADSLTERESKSREAAGSRF